jgi:cysteine desulfurase/selenocysteine lyase
MKRPHPRRDFLRILAAGAAAPLAARFLDVDRALAGEVDDLSLTFQSPDPYETFRGRYLLDPRVTYLNHASIGTVPRAVHRAGLRYREICEENPWLHIWGGAWEEGREEVRWASADLLGCTADEVALTHNTTEGFNLLAQGLPLTAGDEVLFSSLNHVGASACWDHQAPVRGFRVRRFEFPVARVPELTAEEVVRVHEREIRDETRVLVFPHIDNIVGLRHPMEQLVAMARSNGVEFVLVDGAQSAGMVPLDVASAGVDAFATSPHKWIQSPKGLGLLYVRRDLHDRVRPMWVTWGQDRWRGTARIYEDYGTRNLPEVLSLGDAFRFQAAVGEGRKEERYRELFSHLRERVEASSSLEWASPRVWEMGGILAAVRLKGQPAGTTSETLFRDHGVVVRPFPAEELNSLRVSPNLLNTPRELDALVDLLEEGSAGSKIVSPGLSTE